MMEIKKAIEGLEYLAVALNEMIEQGHQDAVELRSSCFMGIKALREEMIRDDRGIFACAEDSRELCSMQFQN